MELHPITRYLKERHLTQAELAEEIGFHESTISRWISGAKRLTAENALMIHNYTQIPLAELRPDLWGKKPQADRVAHSQA